MNKKLIYFSIFYIGILGLGMIMFYKPLRPFRTSLFRSVVKGNWYITSEKDTIYSCGYYGIRKYLSNNDGLNLLSQNRSFCKGTLIGRGCAIGDRYLYVSSRSFLPGKMTSNNGEMGALIVLDKNDLSVVNYFPLKYKAVKPELFGKYLLVSGINCFEIFDLSNPVIPNIVYRHTAKNYTEYQQFSIFTRADSAFVAFPLWSQGIQIWNITEPEKSYLRCKIDLSSNRHYIFSVKADTSFLYSPLGPSGICETDRIHKGGILVSNIGSFDDISNVHCYIPDSLWYRFSTGDLQPTYLEKKDNIVYVNFSEKGVAMFDVVIPTQPKFIGILPLQKRYDVIQPIHIDHNGIMYAGSYYWPLVVMR